MRIRVGKAFMTHRQSVTVISLLVIGHLLSACSGGSAKPEAALWCRWEAEGGNLFSANTLDFYEDGRLVMDGRRAYPAQYVVIAPGRIKITRGGEVEVVDYDLEGNRLTLNMGQSSSHWVRVGEVLGMLTVADAAADPEPVSISTSPTGIASISPTEDNQSILIGDQVTETDEIAEPKITDSAWLFDPVEPINQINIERLVQVYEIENQDIGLAIFSPDGSSILMVNTNGIILLDFVTLQEMKTIKMDDPVDLIQFSQNGKVLAIISKDDGDKLSFYDFSTNQFLNTTEIKNEYGINHVAFSPDNQVVITSNGDYEFRLYNVQTGGYIRQFEGGKEAYGVAYSPDGTIIAGGDSAGNIILWNPNSGSIIRKWVGHSEPVELVHFIKDGSILATSAIGGDVRLWDVSSGVQILKISEETFLVSKLAVSPDHQILATGNYESEVHLYELSTGKELFIITGHSGAISSLAFSNDGKTLLTGDRNGLLKFWAISND